jgi:hypothetical protein
MSFRRVLSVSVLLFAGCKSSLPEDTDTDADTIGDWEVTAISGQATWTLDDCSFTKSYDGLQDESLRHLCPDCTAMFRVEAQITEGDTCASDIVGSGGATEWIGYGADGFYSHDTEYDFLLKTGEATLSAAEITLSGSVDLVTSSDPVSATVEGTLTLTESTGDIMHGMTPSEEYACGWAKADPAAYEGDWAWSDDEMPDGWFFDSCGEAVRLHDFRGEYLVFDISAILCEPCTRMAGEENGFHDEMTEEGIDVTVVTLLIPSVSKGMETVSQTDLQDWIDAYDLHGPVLADRAYGHWVVGYHLYQEDGGVLADYVGVGRPTWVALSPEMEVLDYGTGYSSWYPMKTAILNHAAGL